MDNIFRQLILIGVKQAKVGKVWSNGVKCSQVVSDGTRLGTVGTGELVKGA